LLLISHFFYNSPLQWFSGELPIFKAAIIKWLMNNLDIEINIRSFENGVHRKFGQKNHGKTGQIAYKRIYY